MIQQSDRYLTDFIRAATFALCTSTTSSRHLEICVDASYFPPNKSSTNYGGFAHHRNDPKMAISLDNPMEDRTAKRGQDDCGFRQKEAGMETIRIATFNPDLGLAAVLRVVP